MARNALWRVPPDDPKTRFGWFLADERLNGLPADRAALLCASIVVVSVCLLSLDGVPSFWPLLPIALIVLIVLSAQRPQPLHDVTEWATFPPPGPAFDCRVEIRAETDRMGQGVATGFDDGVVTFVDGWLHYAGRRTEFAIRKADAERIDANGLRHIVFLSHGRAIVFRLRDERDIDLGSDVFRRWWNAVGHPLGQPVMPPALVHPSSVARVWRDAIAAITGASVVGILLFALWRYFPTLALGWWAISLLFVFRRVTRLRRVEQAQGFAAMERKTA